MDGVDLFSVASWPYLPSNLRHLRPPVPNDLPPHQDSTVFAFEDAFEDLMTVIQGGALPDIATKCSQRKLLRQMYPDGEPTWFWLRRLESQGLFVRRPGVFDMRAASDDDFGLLGRHIESAFSRLNWPDWEEFHNQLARRAPDVWRRDGEADIDRSNNGDAPKRKPLDNYPGSSDDCSMTKDSSCQTGHHSHRRGLFPDNFDDLFSSITSRFAEGQKTWDTFVKAIMDNNKTHKPVPANETDQHNTKQDDDHGPNRDREVVTRDEHVDQFGYLHTTVVRKTYDREGNEIGSQTHFTMRPAEKEVLLDGKEPPRRGVENETDVDAHVIDRTTQDADGHPNPEKKPGWFWK